MQKATIMKGRLCFHRDLVTEKLSIGAMLTKYTRSSMLNGIKVYNSKKPLS